MPRRTTIRLSEYEYVAVAEASAASGESISDLLREAVV